MGIGSRKPARLDAAQVRFAFTSTGLNDTADFMSQIRVAVKRGLSKDTALAALTIHPAEWFGVSDRLGRLSVGKQASFLVADGDLFEKGTRIHETWIDGKRFELIKPSSVDVRGQWEIALRSSIDDAPDGSDRWKLKISGTLEKPVASLEHPNAKGESVETKLESITLRDHTLSAIVPAKDLGHTGKIQLSAMAIGGLDTKDLSGRMLFPNGDTKTFTGKRIESSSNHPVAKTTTNEKASSEESIQTKVNFPLGAFGRVASHEKPKHLAIIHATLWTCGEAGVIHDGSMTIEDGKIVAVGTSLDIPKDAVVIDATGKHVSPGMIDCHSHMATDGGVNEGTQAITAEVRIADFIDCDDIDIYRQLAGGLTTSNILHGSANPIGGQNQVIQLRWGELFDAMRFASAPPGIKFALGENVKRSNITDSTNPRYPQTRMGVDQILRDAFHAARVYRQVWERWERDHDSLPPRRDLELEAISQILRGERLVHCHSYRQDEILALLRTAEEFGIKIATFQHILEGYKVADAMARHGAMGPLSRIGGPTKWKPMTRSLTTAL